MDVCVEWKRGEPHAGTDSGFFVELPSGGLAERHVVLLDLTTELHPELTLAVEAEERFLECLVKDEATCGQVHWVTSFSESCSPVFLEVQ